MKQKKKKKERKELEKKKKHTERLIKDRIIRDITIIFEPEKDFYKPKKVSNF